MMPVPPGVWLVGKVVMGKERGLSYEARFVTAMSL